MQPVRLYGTPLSHFTRKIRILLAEFGVPFEFVRATSILGTAGEPYGDNPLMRIPTLVIDGETIIESDHIARHLVRTYDAQDRFGVLSFRVSDMNELAVINGVMDNEVVIILAKRGGFTDTNSVAYFRKLSAAMDSGLAWLDARVATRDASEDASLSYVDICLLCLWDHLVHYKSADNLERYPHIAARVARFADRRSVKATTPAVSLAEATEAGWKPL